MTNSPWEKKNKKTMPQQAYLSNMSPRDFIQISPFAYIGGYSITFQHKRVLLRIANMIIEMKFPHLRTGL